MLALKTIRKTIRAQRRNLSLKEQQSASQALCKRLANHPRFIKSQRIALYWPNDGEIDLKPLLEKAWSMGKQCYLPVLAPLNGKLLFIAYKKGQPLKTNCYGIPEPEPSKSSQLSVWALDTIILPLVAFDPQGNRVGMGGGYYDRTLHFKAKNPARKPALIGVGHHFQKIDSISTRRWDVPLDIAATDTELLEF